MGEREDMSWVPEIVAGLDPGTTESAVVEYDVKHRFIHRKVIMPNEQLLEWLGTLNPKTTVLAGEMIESYGMAVGAEVFQTCVWLGRFQERFSRCGGRTVLVKRGDVKLHLCHTRRAKDANITQALKNRFGEQGTKKNPGITYGISSHMWQALGVAVTHAERDYKDV